MQVKLYVLPKGQIADQKAKMKCKWHINKAMYDLRAVQDNLLSSLNKTRQPLNQGNILPLSLCSIYLSQ